MLEITQFTGPAGCSKTTITELINRYLADDPTRVIAIDTSTCLERSRDGGTNAGRELDNMVEDQKKGIILPGNPVVDSVLENLEWLSNHTNIQHVLLAGSPRSPEEVKRWLRVRKNGIVTFRTVLIECDYEQVKQGVHNRVLKGTIRPDAGPVEIETRWQEYNEKTVPAVNMLPAKLVMRTSRSKKLLARLFDTVNHMDIPERVRRRWLRKLSERSHPIHDAIRGIEMVKAAQAEHAAPVQRSAAPSKEIHASIYGESPAAPALAYA